MQLQNRSELSCLQFGNDGTTTIFKNDVTKTDSVHVKTIVGVLGVGFSFLLFFLLGLLGERKLEFLHQPTNEINECMAASTSTRDWSTCSVFSLSHLPVDCTYTSVSLLLSPRIAVSFVALTAILEGHGGLHPDAVCVYRLQY